MNAFLPAHDCLTLGSSSALFASPPEADAAPYSDQAQETVAAVQELDTSSIAALTADMVFTMQEPAKPTEDVCAGAGVGSHTGKLYEAAAEMYPVSARSYKLCTHPTLRTHCTQEIVSQ